MQDTIEKDGEIVLRYRTLSNGAVMDTTTGKICANPGGGDTAITTANSSELRARNHQLKTEAAMSGVAIAIANGRSLDGVPGSDAAWSMAAEQVAAGFFSDKFNDRNNAMRALTPVVDAVFDKGSQQQQAAAPAAVLNADNMLVVLAMRQQAGDNSSSTHMPPCDTMQVATDSDVIEGDATDSDEHTRTQKKVAGVTG